MKKYDIKEIIARVSLEDLLERFGWETKKKGRYTMVLCKFHHDTAFGSAMIYPDNPDYFMCFTCGQRYNIFDVYMYEHNCDFAEALEALAKDCGLAPLDEGKKVKKMPFTRQELVEIGLCLYDRHSERYVDGFLQPDDVPTDLKAKGYQIYTETFCENPYAIEAMEFEYSYKSKKGCSQMEHLSQLFREDKELFISIVGKKALAAENRHTQNYLFLQAVSRVLDDKGAKSFLTDELMFQSLYGMYTARKIIAKLKRL